MHICTLVHTRCQSVSSQSAVSQSVVAVDLSVRRQPASSSLFYVVVYLYTVGRIARSTSTSSRQCTFVDTAGTAVLVSDAAPTLRDQPPAITSDQKREGGGRRNAGRWFCSQYFR